MKSYCKGLTIDRSLVQSAYVDWEDGRAGHKNRWRVEREYGSADALIDEITNEIRTRTLTTNPLKYRKRTEPINGKVRTIITQSVKQQVLDYIVVRCIKPLLDAKIGYYQTASVPGKGQLWSMRHIRRWARTCTYYVKLDVCKCYPSMSQEMVMDVLRRYVRSVDVLYVCDYLLSTYDEGLAIGSYASMMLAQFVLSFGYHHVESLGKVRRGKRSPLVAHQLWYMDDCLLMGNDKRNLKIAARSLSRYLRDEFGLRVKAWKICRLPDEPLTMVGYIIRPERVTVKSGTFVRARRAFRRSLDKGGVRLARRAISYYGWLRHADCRSFLQDNGIYKAVRRARQTVSANDRDRRWAHAASHRQQQAE